MIHIFIGTKAQYIKTAPVIRRLEEEGIAYNLIDSGQHAEFSRSLRRELGLREPDVSLRQGRDIATTPAALAWFIRVCLLAARSRRTVRHKVFRGEGGICLVHGDTPTTLLSVILARRAGLRVAHLEAGLRSFNYLHPFPEELIRVLVMRLSHVLFAPSPWARGNMERMGLRGEIHDLGGNTGAEAMVRALGEPRPRAGGGGYCVFTVHRVETLHSRRRLAKVVDVALKAAGERAVTFVLHPPTRERLRHYGLLERLEANRSVVLSPLLPYADFIRRLAGADFAVTDGGSIQEECAALGVPCLLMRRKTERPDGLGANVLLSAFDDAAIGRFLAGWRGFARPGAAVAAPPSKRVVDYLRPYR